MLKTAEEKELAYVGIIDELVTKEACDYRLTKTAEILVENARLEETARVFLEKEAALNIGKGLFALKNFGGKALSKTKDLAVKGLKKTKDLAMSPIKSTVDEYNAAKKVYELGDRFGAKNRMTYNNLRNMQRKGTYNNFLKDISGNKVTVDVINAASRKANALTPLKNKK